MKKCIDCMTEKPISEFYVWRRQDRGNKEYSPPRCKVCRSVHRREYESALAHKGYLARHGLEYSDYERILSEQGGGCAICGVTNNGPRRFAVDHDHACCPGKETCGKCVRGLLCTSCNLGLGSFRDNKELLFSAVGYIENNLATAKLSSV